MNPAIPKIPRNFRNKHIHLLPLPPQAPRQQRQTKPLQPIQDVHLIPLAEQLHRRVLGPAVRRPHEHPRRDVHEPRRCHLLGVVVCAVAAEGSTEGERGGAEELAPAEHVGPFVCAVEGSDWEAVVLDFEIAAGFEVST